MRWPFRKSPVKNQITVTVALNSRYSEHMTHRLVEITSLIQEALRSKGYFSGSRCGESWNRGDGYRFVFVLSDEAITFTHLELVH